MLGKVKRINEEVDLRNCVIGSMDVKALYPSIEIDFAVDKCIEMIIKSESNFEKIDTEELGLYLSLTMDMEERKKLKIEDFCARRKRAGKKPTITGCGVKEKKEERWDCWEKPEKTPENGDLKKMVAQALGVATQKSRLQVQRRSKEANEWWGDWGQGGGGHSESLHVLVGPGIFE